MTQSSTPLFQIVPIAPSHDRASFRCGVEALDRYLRTQASQDLKRRVAVAYVLTPDGTTIAGYYTLSQFAVDLADLPETVSRKLPKYPRIPATLLGRLAVSENWRGQKLGELLLIDALKRAHETSQRVASFAVVVDAKDAAAASFYTRYGFIHFPGSENRMFLPMNVVAQLSF